MLAVCLAGWRDGPPVGNGRQTVGNDYDQTHKYVYSLIINDINYMATLIFVASAFAFFLFGLKSLSLLLTNGCNDTCQEMPTDVLI